MSLYDDGTGAFDLWGSLTRPGGAQTVFGPKGGVNPLAFALMGVGQGLLKAGQPSPYPTGLGQAVGSGVQGGVQGLLQGQQFAQAAQQAKVMNELKELQVKEAKRKQEEHDRNLKLQEWAFSQLGFNPFGPQSTPTAPAPMEVPAGLSTASADAIGAPWASAPVMSDVPRGVLYSGEQPQPPIPQTGGMSIPAGVDRRAAAMSLVPQLAPLGKMIQDANKPTDKMREAVALGLQPGTPAFNAYVGTQYNQGGAWQVRPDGGIGLAPGYAQGVGDVAGAEQGARAQYDLVEVPVPGGGTQQMTRAEAVRRLGGGGGRTPTQVAGPAPMLPAPGGTQGGLGFRRPAADTAADTEFGKTMAEGYAKQYQEIAKADFNAPAKIQQYQRLGSLLGQVKTGKFTATTSQLKAAAKSAGIDLGALGVADDVPQAQAAQALSSQLALELRNPAGGASMPGAMSDKDREFLTAMVPSLENDPGAIGLMIEYRTKLAQRDRDVAKLAREYRKRNGGKFDDGFYDELAKWSDKNPLFNDNDKDKAKAPGKPANAPKFLGFE
jgi:hypothetical protein